jgi:hypothetical protein
MIKLPNQDIRNMHWKIAVPTRWPTVLSSLVADFYRMVLAKAPPL